MKKFFVTELYPHALFTAGTLREDIEIVLQKCGYESLIIDTQARELTAKLGSYIKAENVSRELPEGSIIFFHFPIRSRVIRNFFERIKRKGQHTIAYVHDFEGLRDRDESMLKKELQQLEAFEIIIAQNAVMKDWIRLKTGHKKLLSLECYDYLLETIPEHTRKKTPALSFAGNLDKAPFIELLDQLPQLHFHVYGQSGISKSNVTRHGPVHPRKLPAVMQGSFGLVWDGDRIETCSGGPGEYLRINTSHKLALHIMSGLPVIIWEEDAMASWVVDKGIGFTVSSLREVPEKIKALKDEDYNGMLQKQKSLQPLLAAGNYLRSALENAEALID